MNHPRLARAALVSVLLAASARSEQDPAAEAANLMRGAWEGSSPGNALILNARPGPAAPNERIYSLDVTILGKSGDTNVNIEGSLRFQREGDSVRVWWATERGGCDIPLGPAGDGFHGEAMPGVCATAFQKPIVGKWLLDFDGATLRVSREDTGETLRFRKKPAKTPTP
ncbi:MAG TPA: hypothetical protein VIE39_07345 [Thermoanaerobaculia bacterium]|jgi:hypothetical protein